MRSEGNSTARVSMLLIRLCVVIVAIGLIGSGFAQTNYPTRPIEMIIVFGLGGGSDMNIRPLASVSQEVLGAPMIVRAITGASGGLGTNALVQASPDGYTLALLTPTPLLTLPKLGQVPYTLDDMEPVAVISSERYFLGVRGDAPWQTFEELLEHARNHPGELTSGTSGELSTLHVITAGIEDAAGVEFNIIPFEGTGPARAALLGGHIDFIAGNQISETLSLVESGDLRPLVVFDTEREPQLPDVPTAQEYGLDVVVNVFFGVFAPVGVPEDILDFLSDKIGEAIESPSYIAVTRAMGVVPRYLPRHEFREWLAATDASYARILRAIGVID